MIWELEYRARPWLLNEERAGGRRGAGGRYGRARLTGEWRDCFAGLAQEQRIPPLQWFTVEAIPICLDRRRPDVGNIYPAVKAAIDGLIDAGVAPDDNDVFLHALTFRPAWMLGYSALRLRVAGEPCTKEEADAREQAYRKRLLRQFAR